jgi:hypothetical protein
MGPKLPVARRRGAMGCARMNAPDTPHRGLIIAVTARFDIHRT